MDLLRQQAHDGYEIVQVDGISGVPVFASAMSAYVHRLDGGYTGRWTGSLDSTG